MGWYVSWFLTSSTWSFVFAIFGLPDIDFGWIPGIWIGKWGQTCDWAHAKGIGNGLVCQLVLDKFNLKFCVCYFWMSKYRFWLDPGFFNVFFATLFWRREIFEKKLEFFWRKTWNVFQAYKQLLKSIGAIPFGVGRVDFIFVIFFWRRKIFEKNVRKNVDEKLDFFPKHISNF